jgi:quercetin dioxygenase-like cupin family protein
MSAEFKPNVNLMKAFNSQVMLIDDLPGSENGQTFIKAGADGPPIHIHPEQDENFKVVSGQLEVYQVNKWITVKAGEEIFTPKNMAHTYRSRDKEDCIFEYRLTPDRNFSDMMRTFEKLINEGKLKGTSDIKSIIYLALSFKKYGSEVTSVNPPQFVINIMAGLGNLLGFKL